MIGRVWLTISVVAAFSAQHAAAADFPNLVGEWKGTATPVHVGTTGHTTAQGDGVNFSNEIAFTYVVTEQKGSGFTGFVESRNKKEPFIGSIREDKTAGIMVDEDGNYEFKIIGPNIIDLCYWHITETSRVTACLQVERSQ